MGKSKRLRLRDMRDAYRLIGECRDLGGEVRAWREHMLMGLRRLVDAQVAMAAEVREGGPSWKVALHEPMDVGWPSAASREMLMRYEEESDPSSDITFRPLIGLARPLVTRMREQVLGDRQWYTSVAFNDYRRSSEVDDWINSVSRLADPPGFHVICFHRPLGESRFTARERRLVHIFHHELDHLMGPVLSRETDPIVSSLPRRLGEILDCLLEGDSEKQVASRLGLSRTTVHGYVTDLYRRFDVSSRAELLAHCLRRRVR
jgi:DNA-binding CsgD family transcriptional regulator